MEYDPSPTKSGVLFKLRIHCMCNFITKITLSGLLHVMSIGIKKAVLSLASLKLVYSVYNKSNLPLNLSISW